MHVRIRRLFLSSLVIASLVVVAGPARAGDAPVADTFRVTIQNLTPAQPMSPPVVASHRPSIAMFSPGMPASSLIEAIAEDGDGMPMFGALSLSPLATDVMLADAPLTPSGATVGAFTDAVEVELLPARPGDRLSLATMLICTNDGFTGVDSMVLPVSSSLRLVNAYDAGTEDNTEVSLDIVDPCSALGPVVLTGDPNGNLDDEVDSSAPRKPIGGHAGVYAIADLLAAHDWQGPVAKVTVTRLDPDATNFTASLWGLAEVPPRRSTGRGNAVVRLVEVDGRVAARFALRVGRLTDVVQAHLHLGSPAENGPVVAFLYGPEAPQGEVSGLLAEGALSEADLVGPLAGDMTGFVAALRDGRLYVNVHSAANPGGEIRGQLGARPGARPLSVRPDLIDHVGSRQPGR